MVQVQQEKKTLGEANDELNATLSKTKEEHELVVATYDERVAELEKELAAAKKALEASNVAKVNVEEKVESLEQQLAGARAENAVQRAQLANLEDLIASKVGVQYVFMLA